MGVDVFVFQEYVSIDFTGVERFLTLKGHLEVPMHDITSARVAPVSEVRPGLGWRVGGSYWPGRLITGHFTVPDHPGARQLWCVQRDDEVLVIETDLDRPRRIVLQHPDRHDIAWLIGERLPEATS
jgi:hypothetical protein